MHFDVVKMLAVLVIMYLFNLLPISDPWKSGVNLAVIVLLIVGVVIGWI